MYDAQAVEPKWNKRWREGNLFRFDPKDTKKKLFVIDTPPPFTDGQLHMGQVFWVSYIDTLARYKKMKGFNVLYPQGWDMHGFPTELAVEKRYGKRLTRDQFYERCIEVSKENMKKMRDQMLQLGSTFDENYEYRTTDKEYITKVQLSLLQMNEKKMIYRAEHPVMWCIKDVTGIGNPETEEREEDSVLNHIKFQIKDSKEHIIIATSRSEMLHACVAVAVNSTDKRYKKLIGKSVEVPIFGTFVEIIGDEGIDIEFGTGAEMICTFGDKADVEMFMKHSLDFIAAIDENGKLQNAGIYNGLSLDEAREAIVKELQKLKLLTKQENIKHVVKVHDRCKTRVEYRNAKQWFIKIKEHSERIKQIANEMKWYPDTSRQRLHDWANFIEWDWNISRNRVFGTPIPFWACEKCDFVLAPDKNDLPIDTNKDKPKTSKCPKCGGTISGTRETSDGWVDSSITPMIIAGWPKEDAFYKRAFPASVRIQGTDIIRTWAFYTIFRTWALTGDKPFENIIAHSMILGQDGVKMSKSLGNGIIPEELMSKYPIDAIRLWVALTGGITKDKIFSYQDLDYAKSFIIKLYNTANFVKGFDKIKIPKEPPIEDFNVFDVWILTRLNEIIKEVTNSYDNFDLFEAMSKAINFYWHEFADYYIENVKHRVYSEDKKMEKSKIAAAYALKNVFEASVRLFAPVVPHVCEEINSMFNKGSVFEQLFPPFIEKKTESDFVINGLIQRSAVEGNPENVGALLNDIIGEVRKQKANNRIALNKEITAININVPDEYYSTVVNASDELSHICKAKNVKVSKHKDFSVSVKI